LEKRDLSQDRDHHEAKHRHGANPLPLCAAMRDGGRLEDSATVDDDYVVMVN